MMAQKNIMDSEYIIDIAIEDRFFIIGILSEKKLMPTYLSSLVFSHAVAAIDMDLIIDIPLEGGLSNTVMVVL